MFKHVVFGSCLAAGAAGALGFWKVCVCLRVLLDLKGSRQDQF